MGNTRVPLAMLTPIQAAAQLGCSSRTIYRMIDSGELPACRLGGRGNHIRIAQADLDKALRPIVTAEPA